MYWENFKLLYIALLYYRIIFSHELVLLSLLGLCFLSKEVTQNHLLIILNVITYILTFL